jgi:hypothetical protein
MKEPRRFRPSALLADLQRMQMRPMVQQSPRGMREALPIFFLIWDSIGEIAASHHWDMSRVENEFGDPLSPPAAFPWWPVDALILGVGRRAGDGSEHAASLVCVSRRSRARAEPIDPRIAPR